MTTTNVTFDLESVDDYLGPRAHRFFGEGFKRAAHRLTGTRVEPAPDGGGAVSATASVDYPVDWSRKGSHDQKPHLSTIDVVVLGGWLVQLHLARTRGLTPADLAGAELLSARVKAGTTPVEDDLTGFPVWAQVSPGQADGDAVVTTAVCRIGNLTLRCAVRHAPGTLVEVGGTGSDLALGPHDLRLFADGHTLRAQHVEHVTIDAERARATAHVRFDGLVCPIAPSTAVVDAFAVGLQLGQVLLYELDGVRRADSHTLWMRQTTFDCTAGEHVVPGPVPVGFGLEGTRLLRNGKGETWRLADVVGSLLGVAVRCSVAHRVA